MKADIAVVGSGLAALVAARAVQQAGRQPVLIWPGLSSLYFVFATVDVLGYRDASSPEPVENPREAVATLIREQPSHPYAKAGLAALENGTGLLTGWLRDAGLGWQGQLARNVLLPTALGVPKPSCLVPDSMIAGDLASKQPIVFCGFEGYSDFIPELAASNLSSSWRGGTVQTIRIALPGNQAGRLFSSIDLARSFENDPFTDGVAERIGRAGVAKEARVGLPAIVGMTGHARAFSRLQQALDHPLFEIPTLPPSILGLRLFDRLRQHLQETGVEIIWAAPAHAAEVADHQCHAIRLKAAGRELPIEARAYVLALEDTVDGALRFGMHAARDPFFHQQLAEARHPIDRSRESLFAPQPFASVGYAVNERLQPLHESGEALADNVFVAGGAIAGYDPVGTKSRGGLDIATGYRAAQEAMAA